MVWIPLSDPWIKRVGVVYINEKRGPNCVREANNFIQQGHSL
jgi:hypothetical protein